ncbi:hypothetical protein [Spiribacter sp. SSL99]|uniref:hypothetical protein n=1 Tax=Spiribacter sp. SSL99 TaxID=1866884 RepID=UPI001331089D|nr:hypothetical protein [Spiribacter sp. SSL99]
MMYRRNSQADWIVVYNACGLEDLALPWELFIESPLAILRGLDLLDVLDTIEAGERPNRVEPATPEWWDAVYDVCPFSEMGITRRAFKIRPWELLLRHGFENAPRWIDRGPGSKRRLVGSGSASAMRSIADSLERRGGDRSTAAGGSRRSSHRSLRCGLVHRITDGLAVIVDAFYPLALTTEGRWRVDRERIAATGDRYRMRLLFLSLINALGYVMVYEMGESLISEVAMLALVGITTAGMVRLGAVEASVED